MAMEGNDYKINLGIFISKPDEADLIWGLPHPFLHSIPFTYGSNIPTRDAGIDTLPVGWEGHSIVLDQHVFQFLSAFFFFSFFFFD